MPCSVRGAEGKVDEKNFTLLCFCLLKGIGAVKKVNVAILFMLVLLLLRNPLLLRGSVS